MQHYISNFVDVKKVGGGIIYLSDRCTRSMYGFYEVLLAHQGRFTGDQVGHVLRQLAQKKQQWANFGIKICVKGHAPR